MDIRKSGLIGSGDSGSYSDLNRLQQLKVGDKNGEANVRKVAQEFESLFLNEMLKSMRKATDVIAQDNPLNTPAAKQYQDMYDQQLAVSLSREGGGIGLANVLMRQMMKNKPANPGATHTALTAAAPVATPTPIAAGTTAQDGPLSRVNGQRPMWASRAQDPLRSTVSHNDMALLNQRRLSLPSKLTDRLLTGIVPSAGATADTSTQNVVPTRNSAAADAVLRGEWRVNQGYAESQGKMRVYGRAMAQPPLAPAKRAFSSADDFVATMLPMAQQAAQRIGIDPRYLVAQAALETGWGKSVMRQQDGSSSHNLFGIKANKSWQGAQARAITSEFRDGQMVKETAAFRSYDSYQDSFHDLVTLLQSNNRYQEVLKVADKPEQFVRELQKAGYATDPDYASKISQIAKQMKNYESYAAAGVSTNL